MDKNYPTRWRFISRSQLQEGYFTARCHCVICQEEWYEVVNGLKIMNCPFCETETGRVDYEVIPKENKS